MLAFTGVLLNSTAPDFDPAPGNANNRYVFVSLIDANLVTPSLTNRLYDNGTWASNNCFYPSKIIELPITTDPGFLVTGAAPNATNNPRAMYYMRTLYNIGTFSGTTMTVVEPTVLSGAGSISGSDMYYDATSDEVWVAGVASSLKAVVVDKLTGMNTPGIARYNLGGNATTLGLDKAGNVLNTQKFIRN